MCAPLQFKLCVLMHLGFCDFCAPSLRLATNQVSEKQQHSSQTLLHCCIEHFLHVLDAAELFCALP